MRITSPDYSGKSDDELLALAADFDSLTPEGREALRVALKKKGINSSIEVPKFVQEQRRLSLADEANRLGLSGRGNGRKMYGKFNRELSGLEEEYDATVFVVLSYFPLIPTGTYRVSREQGSGQVRFLSQLPLDWIQVVWVWLKAVTLAVTGFVLLILVIEISRHR